MPAHAPRDRHRTPTPGVAALWWLAATVALAAPAVLIGGCEATQSEAAVPSAGGDAPAPSGPAPDGGGDTDQGGDRTPAVGDGGTAGGASEDDRDGDGVGDAPAPAVDAGPWLTFEDRPCPEDNTLSWENFGAALMLAHCTGCHGRAAPEGARQGAPASVTFDDPNSIRDLEDRIWSRAGDQNATMPPVGGPSPEDREKLGQWLACGSPVRSQL